MKKTKETDEERLNRLLSKTFAFQATEIIRLSKQIVRAFVDDNSKLFKIIYSLNLERNITKLLRLICTNIQRIKHAITMRNKNNIK